MRNQIRDAKYCAPSGKLPYRQIQVGPEK